MELLKKPDASVLDAYKYVIITPDGVGSKGDEAMISGCLNLLQGEKALLLTPNAKLWQTELYGRAHLFDELFVPIEEMPHLFAAPKRLIVIGADTLDGSCGYESAHWRLQTIEACTAAGGKATVFCSVRSDVPETLSAEWRALSEEVEVLVRDDISAQNYRNLTGKTAVRFSDLAFFAHPISTHRVKKFAAEIAAAAQHKTVIGLEISETMFRSFHTEITDAGRQKFAQTIAALAVQGLQPEDVCVVLLTHDTRSWSEHWSDYQYAQAAQTYYKAFTAVTQVVLQPPQLTQAEIVSAIGLCDVLICGRMHMSITAYCGNVVPVLLAGVGKNYVMIDKVRGMCTERLGTPENLVQQPHEIPAVRDLVLTQPALRQTLQQMNEKHYAEEQQQALWFAVQMGLQKQTESNTEALQETAVLQMLERSSTLYAAAIESATEIEKWRSVLAEKEIQVQAAEEQTRVELARLQASNRMLHEKNQAKELALYEAEQALQAITASEQHFRNEVGALMGANNALQQVYASRTWRYSQKVAKLARKLCPPCSLRAKIAGGAVRLPMRGVRWVRSLPAKCRAKQEEKVFFQKLLPIELPQYEAPLVSIILPVYNQFAFTYNCLRTIAAECADVPYEVILADDNSTDDTRRIAQKVQGLVIVRNAENLRFLRNCNHAATKAKGKYLVFLNNDTEVQPDWLQSLLRTIEADKSVGMVGSKLIYANGLLQEAGGILWSNGSAWNYGRMDDPEKSEYNYVKEVDYLSGCSILLPRALWEEIGGFDDRFAPAYCEDSDLAFAVREKGYKVVYQPLSVVIHHEGISNGTDLSGGQKQYQILNAKKFYQKWKAVLEKEQLPDATNVFCARDRSAKKPCVLFIEHFAPTFDQDAGSRTVYEYLRLFVEMGYNVKFLPDNFYRTPKYVQALQQLGIEVLYGPEYAAHWKEWIVANKDTIQFVFANRPHISIKYLDFLRENTNAKIIYYGHDLHSLREMREYELTGDESLLESSERWEAIEYSLMRKADVAYYPSKIEQDYIKNIDADINVKVLTPYIFRDVVTPDYRLQNRKDILFIGGFNHRPNVDAVLWFAKEVWPIVQKELPAMHWHILGSNPPQAVKRLQNKTTTVHGFVTDEELENFYATTRLSIVPLRYGAGIKGKVVEAMKFGIPVLTTSVGAEGILGAEEFLAIADEPEAFAERLIALYQDEKVLRQMSADSCDYIRAEYGPENAITIIKDDFT